MRRRSFDGAHARRLSAGLQPVGPKRSVFTPTASWPSSASALLAVSTKAVAPQTKLRGAVGHRERDILEHRAVDAAHGPF
jgi:hypothetical protein